jgi:phosphoribosylaminoimidazole carboxylase (NCAIR synthetase)
LGYAIHKMEESVELSSKESQAKVAEMRDKAKTITTENENSPVQNLRDLSRQKNKKLL